MTRHNYLNLALTLLLLAGTVKAATSEAPVDALDAYPVAADELAATPHFVFHSDPWVNLHHFLYHEARNTVLREEILRGRVRTYLEDRGVDLSDEEQTLYGEVLEVYAKYGEDDILFDEDLFRIGVTLMSGPEAFPRGADAEPAYAALERMMPLYLAHWWPRHDASNRARVAELAGYLDSYGEAMAARVAAVYGTDWPDPIRVDVTNYSGRHGAYATSDPHHIVLASPGDWFPGLLALDVLFHESGHVAPFENQVLPRSEDAAAAAGIEEGGVWHAFLFYVPSQAAREVLPEEHVPYAYFEDGPLAEGRMSRAEPFIRDALEQTRDLDEVFRIIHEARAAAGGSLELR